MADLTEQLQLLVQANRILAREGVVDAYGHVSLRHPDNPNHFILACSRSPELVEVDDLMVYELDGTPVTQTERRPYAERFIHGAVFEARPEIQAVIHNHSHEVIPFGVTGAKLRPLVHVAATMGGEVPVWDIREHFGDCTTMLVVNMDQGRALAKGLGPNNVALMRGHGCVVVGTGLKQAVATAIYLQVNARLQLDAVRLAGSNDGINFLSKGEIEGATGAMLSPLSMARAWEYWQRRAGC
jgi:ribulose-5-phosphate 4-epimerase/fuculose-1-phosphate aldolase